MRRLATITATLACLVPAVAKATTCSISATTLAFGTVALATVNSTNTVTVQCNGFAFYTVALSTGGSGSYSPRTMRSGLNTLTYNIYMDSGRTTVWGSGSSGTSTNFGFAGFFGGTNQFTGYGQVPAQASAAPGIYTDSITVTVSY